MIENRDDTFLARWMSGEISEQERREFEASPEFVHYQKILAGVDAILPQSVDEIELLSKVRRKLETEKNVPKKGIVRHLWAYAVAASVALVIGFFIFIGNNDLEIESGYGEQLAVNLPDGSEVVLNSRSRITYNEEDWDDERRLMLEGEAYFKVKPGAQFTVQTKRGNVAVLGTQFNVMTLDGLFEVACYEGKVAVSVEGNDNKHILVPGNAYRKLFNRSPAFYSLQSKKPGWVSKMSSFKSAPVKYVLIALENQFNVKFEGARPDENLVFTGSFPHDDVEVALKIVFGSLQIDYKLKDGKVVFLEK